MKIVVPPIFSVAWKLLLLIFTLLIGIGVYLYNYPLAINIQVLPYGSFRVKYKLFDKQCFIDNIIINNVRIYIQPIAIPLIKTKIPRVYIGVDKGYIIIRNLNPFAIKNNPIGIEVKNVCLQHFFPNKIPKILSARNLSNGTLLEKNLATANLSDIRITTDATLTLLDNKQFGLDVHSLSIVNTPIGDINAKMTYCMDDLHLKLEFPKYQHTLSCNGKLDIHKPFKWDLTVVGVDIAKVKNLKIKDTVYNGNVQYSINWTHGYSNEKLQCKIVSENTLINNSFCKAVNLGKVCLTTSYINNRVNSILKLFNFKHTINCNGIIRNNNFDLNIVPKNPINIKQFNIINNLVANGTLKYTLHLKRINNRNTANGDINLSNGNIQSKGNKLLNNIGINIKLNNDLLILKKCEATLENFIKCKVQASGKLNINDLNMDIRIRIPNGTLHNVPIIKSVLEADIITKGHIKSPDINGVVTLINSSIDATSIISSSMNSTDIVSSFMNKNKPKSPKLNECVLPINANIKININPKIIVSGAGLKSSWKGGGHFIAIKKQPIKWDLKFNIIDGQYEIVNKKAKLSSGEVLFNSQLPNYYKITIIGQKKIDIKEIVGVKFIQYNDNTTMDFFSTTMRSKQDILSLFLFEKENSELSTSEAYSLGMLAQNLATGNDNMFSKLNKMLKIDTFSIKHNTDGSDNYNTVVVGKKIGKWHLNFEQGRNLDEAQLSIDRKVKKRTKIDLSLSKKTGLEGGLMWSKRY